MSAAKSTDAIRTLQSTPLNEAALKLAPETKSNGNEKRSDENPMIVNQARFGLPLPPPSVLGHP